MDDPTASIAPFTAPSSSNQHNHEDGTHCANHQHDNHNHQIDPSSFSLIDQMLMNLDGPDNSLVWDDSSLSNDFLDLDNFLNDPLFWETPSLTDHQDNNVQNHHHHEVAGTSYSCDGINRGGDQGLEMGREAVDNIAGNHHQCDDQKVEANVMAAPVEALAMEAPVEVVAVDNNNNDDINDPTAAINSCSFCQVLREIIHTNGTLTTKFEIHGNVGMVSHGILETRYASSIDGFPPTIQDCRKLDFCRQSLDEIKEYMKQYLEEYEQKGYILLQDPLSYFYEAICLGFDWVNNPGLGLFHAHEQQEAGTSNQEMNPPPLEVPSSSMEAALMADDDNQQPCGPTKSDLALQRERIKNMTFADFAQYFDTPIEEAARQLRLCATVIKKKLRSYNISRWPYRKVRSLQRKLSKWREELEGQDPEARAGIQTEIVKLQQQLDEILSGNIEALNNIL